MIVSLLFYSPNRSVDFIMFFAPMIAWLPQKPPLTIEISSAVRLGLYWSIPQTVSLPSPVTCESTAVFMWVSLCGMPHATFRLVTARVPPSAKNTARGNWRGEKLTISATPRKVGQRLYHGGTVLFLAAQKIGEDVPRHQRFGAGKTRVVWGDRLPIRFFGDLHNDTSPCSMVSA